MDMDAHSVAETSSLSEEDPFIITDEQHEYYLSNFKQLQKLTQGGKIDLTGALEGKHPVVRSFFRKSEMSNEELGKVWHLADVNQDGFLNAEEFCTAMHLIVMRVKGDIDIPEKLPVHLKPRLTPPRKLCPISAATANSEPPLSKTSGNGSEWAKFESIQDQLTDEKKANAVNSMVK